MVFRTSRLPTSAQYGSSRVVPSTVEFEFRGPQVQSFLPKDEVYPYGVAPPQYRFRPVPDAKLPDRKVRFSQFPFDNTLSVAERLHLEACPACMERYNFCTLYAAPRTMGYYYCSLYFMWYKYGDVRARDRALGLWYCDEILSRWTEFRATSLTGDFPSSCVSVLREAAATGKTISQVVDDLKFKYGLRKTYTSAFRV